ncbi:MAG: hypothetical protein H6Q51_800 [Deltaproteobacteria bacterium]|nr:hypothetical protein [Deltaproteobacteria bacterium]
MIRAGRGIFISGSLTSKSCSSGVARICRHLASWRTLKRFCSSGALAVVEMNQVPLAKGAAGQELDGIHPAHVGLNHGHDLLVLGMGTDLSEGNLRCPDADGQAGTHVAVKGTGLFNHCFSDGLLCHGSLHFTGGYTILTGC